MGFRELIGQKHMGFRELIGQKHMGFWGAIAPSERQKWGAKQWPLTGAHLKCERSIVSKRDNESQMKVIKNGRTLKMVNGRRLTSICDTMNYIEHMSSQA